jgi:hypothetical protein
MSSGQPQQMQQGTAQQRGTSPSEQRQGTAQQQRGTSPAQQNQGTAQQQRGTASGAAATTGSTSTTVNLSSEQRTQAVQTLRSVNIQPVREHVSITVGQTLPSTVTQLYDCPETLESLLTGVRECKVVLVNDRYYIVEPSTRRVVTVIESHG